MVEPKTELQKNAIANARRSELESFQRAMDLQWLNSRMEDGRMGRCLALIQREAEMEKDFQERTDHAAIVNAKAQQEVALGLEIAKIQREETCKLARRHYLRERDPSLKTLAKKLQAGYVCRDLQQQILNNEYRRLREKAEDKKSNDILLGALFNDKEARENEEKEKMERNAKYCRELQQQLVNRQLQRQCQYEDTCIEKKMLEDIMRTISDEDQRELQKKHDQTEKMRNEMVTFQKARTAWKEKQKQMVINEEREIEKQIKEAGDRSAAIVAERERKLRVKEEINNRIVSKILADEAERQERTNIIKLLQEQEYLEKNVQNDIAEKEKFERVKNDTKEALTAQMNHRRRLAKEQQELGVNFRLETEKKIAEDLEKDRQKELKKREKGKQYSQELLKQIESNAHRRKKEHELEEMRAQYVWDYDRKWREEVAEERKKMVEEHVPNVLGFLQAAVITKDDLPSVRAGANRSEELSKLDIESMSTSKQPQRFAKCNAQCRTLREF